jgi:hypothetical protein
MPAAPQGGETPARRGCGVMSRASRSEGRIGRLGVRTRERFREREVVSGDAVVGQAEET